MLMRIIWPRSRYQNILFFPNNSKMTLLLMPCRVLADIDHVVVVFPPRTLFANHTICKSPTTDESFLCAPSFLRTPAYSLSRRNGTRVPRCFHCCSRDLWLFGECQDHGDPSGPAAPLLRPIWQAMGFEPFMTRLVSTALDTVNLRFRKCGSRSQNIGYH